jgi:cobalt-zinc-cadmium efflux system protein
MLSVDGTEEIHDLHVWCLSSSEFALSAHAVITAAADHDKVLSDIALMLGDKFNIRHITVQLERDNRRLNEPAHL